MLATKFLNADLIQKTPASKNKTLVEVEDLPNMIVTTLASTNDDFMRSRNKVVVELAKAGLDVGARAAADRHGGERGVFGESKKSKGCCLTRFI